MPEPIKGFIKLFDAKLSLNRKLVVKKGSRYFLLSQKLEEYVEKSKEWFYAGVYLGEVKDGKFHPSFPLLYMLADKAQNKVTVDDKAAWLFVCGRDIFKEGILNIEGSKAEGAYTLIFNRHGECLGFGKIRRHLDSLKSGVAVENIFDLGDFLRRER